MPCATPIDVLQVSKAVIPAATERRPEQRFGFVHFVEQSSADRVVADANAGEKPELDGNMLEVPSPPLLAAGKFRLLQLQRTIA